MEHTEDKQQCNKAILFAYLQAIQEKHQRTQDAIKATKQEEAEMMKDANQE